MKVILGVILDQYQRINISNPCKTPAPEQVLITVMLAKDKKLIRDARGRWNHREAKRNGWTTGVFQDDFCSGFKGRTIERLIEAGRLRETKFDEKGRSIEVAWVPI